MSQATRVLSALVPGLALGMAGKQRRRAPQVLSAAEPTEAEQCSFSIRREIENGKRMRTLAARRADPRDHRPVSVVPSLKARLIQSRCGVLHYANRARAKPGLLFDMTIDPSTLRPSLLLRKRSLFRMPLSLLSPTRFPVISNTLPVPRITGRGHAKPLESLHEFSTKPPKSANKQGEK